jgi:toxin-antitoxin system PIN domain toxin
VSALLDVNVLIALLDRRRVHHPAAQRWFQIDGMPNWATCPMTENGVLRIVGHPRYLNSPGSPAIVSPLLQRLLGMGGHVFWSDDVSLLDNPLVDTQAIVSDQITDTYLLALAVKHGGRLATFDRRLVTSAVRGGAAALHLIPMA